MQLKSSNITKIQARNVHGLNLFRAKRWLYQDDSNRDGKGGATRRTAGGKTLVERGHKRRRIVMDRQELKIHSDFVEMLECLVDAPISQKGRILMEVGAVLTDYHQSELGLAVWNQALQHFIRTGDRKAEGRCRRDIATVYTNIGDVTTAEKIFKEALKICEEMDDKVWVGMIRKDLQSLGRPEVKTRKSLLNTERASSDPLE